MDAPEVSVGNTLYLPVNVAGALLYMGDGHAAMGDGEVAGTRHTGRRSHRICPVHLVVPNPANDRARTTVDLIAGHLKWSSVLRIQTHMSLLLIRAPASMVSRTDGPRASRLIAYFAFFRFAAQ